MLGSGDTKINVAVGVPGNELLDKKVKVRDILSIFSWL